MRMRARGAGKNQCMMKSACDSPVTFGAGRVVIDTGRSAPAANHSGDNPWNCLAQRAMLGGYPLAIHTS